MTTLKTYFEPGSGRWRNAFYHVIFESESPRGKAFDLGLIVVITASVLAVMSESIGAAANRFGAELRTAEWVFTWLFLVEYVVRLWCLKRPIRYARSFFGIIDLISVLPSFIALLLPQGRYLLVVRILRLLRIFRILKLTPYVAEANVLVQALSASRRKIAVFLFAVLTLVVVIGATMYVVEGPANGFTSIPTSIYWTIVTLTTVGYGDISPQTPLGKFVASMVMVVGYAIIAVPTGIVTAEMSHLRQRDSDNRRCSNCGTSVKSPDAKFCRICASELGGASS